VLAILAEKCGAKSVLAIDNDEWSIRNATENIALNDAGIITVEKRNLLAHGVLTLSWRTSIRCYCSKSTRFTATFSFGSVLIVSGFCSRI